MFTANWPFTNPHELNLDWIIEQVKSLSNEMQSFVLSNTIKYADPLIWSITRSYERNTVVLDESGNAYLSVAPVPVGIAIDRPEYWTPIGNFSDLWGGVQDAITAADEGSNNTASADRDPHTLVWLNGVLYTITQHIGSGEAYQPGTNCEVTTISDQIVALYAAIADAASKAASDLSAEVQKINTTTSAQISELREELTGSIETVSSDLTDEVRNRKAAVSAVQASITTETQQRQSADTALQNKIDAVAQTARAKKYVFIGDSYGNGEGVGVSSGMGWCTKVPQLLGLSTSDYKSFAKGGLAFSRSGYKIVDYMVQQIGSIPEDFRTAVTDVFVFMGYNDQDYNSSTILNDIGTFCELCADSGSFPNARVHIGMIGWSPEQQIRANIANHVLPAYSQCGTHGAAYIPGGESVMHKYTLFGADNIHPTDEGYTILDAAIASAVISGSMRAEYAYNQMSMRADGIGNSYSAGNFSETIAGDCWTLAKSDGDRITVNCSSQSLSGDTEYKIGQLPTIYGRPYDAGMACQAMTSGYVFTSSGFKRIEMMISIRDQNVYIRNVTLPESGSYTQLNGVTQIAIQWPTLTMCSRFV